ncbi:MAG: SDR family oxidoreductase [Emcibacteraceae bacterium]|nr:SDR family oxidoreductase [Emcibacteraceae bacterium]
MDLGITGRKAIICASSKGLGKACAMTLAGDGVHVFINGRNAAILEKTAQEIREATGSEVTTVACDVTTPEGRAKILAACPDPDILINNAGGPPTGNFRDWDRDTWIAALDSNMLTPIELIKSVVDGMIERKFGRIVNITSGAVKAPINVLGLSNGARSGLTGFCAGVARTTVKDNVTINGLLPGPFETDRIAEVIAGEAKAKGISEEDARIYRMATNPAGRFGRPEEFGAACGWLCSANAGFVTGQNILIDGGNYPGVL